MKPKALNCPPDRGNSTLGIRNKLVAGVIAGPLKLEYSLPQVDETVSQAFALYGLPLADLLRLATDEEPKHKKKDTTDGDKQE